jgi:signal transduction histidine kinase
MERWEHLLNELRAELTLREQELDLLHEIDLRLLDPDQTAQDIFSFTVKGAQKLLRSNHTTILMRRSTFLEPTYSNLTSVVGQRVLISDSLTGLSLEEDRTVSVHDLTKKPYSDRYAPLRGYRGARMRSLLATPIRIRGAAIGVLNAESRNVHAFQPVHERMAAAVAAQIAIALQHTQTLASTELFADVDRLIFADEEKHDDDTDDAIADETQMVIQKALKRVMSALQNLEHVEHHRADILFKRSDTELEIMHSTKAADVGLMVPVGNSISGRAIREKRTIIVGDVTTEPEYQLATESIRSEIAVPILLGEDDELAIGVLNVESTEEDAFTGFYQVVLESFAEKVKTLLAFAKLRADVTEALELRTANEVLAAVGDQTAHIVHRLNNTVGAMRVRIVELQKRNAAGTLNGSDYLTDSLDSLRDQAERTLRMPSEMAQTLKPASNNVDVNESVQRALQQTDRGSVQVILDLGDGIPLLPLVNFDIVVQNLIQNALDAMPDGGQLDITTCAVIHKKLGGGYFQLVVRDNGPGIPAEIRKRVFELNFTTKGTQGAGRGLGLWWVRKFVRSAKGDISIRSTPGSGTEVTVKIPVEPTAGNGAAGIGGTGPKEESRWDRAETS